MTNKEKYALFMEKTYVPIYSKPWWLDAVCMPENWQVWIYEKEGNIMAAMPYYIEQRGKYHYITKPPLTQNNGIIFNYPKLIKAPSKASFEEEIINAACKFINSIGIDVYEQQYQTTFCNCSPFLWNGYEAIIRYTYIFSADELNDLDKVWAGIDKKKRAKIRKGEKNGIIQIGLDKDIFYDEVQKVYEKQKLVCPFSRELWWRIYNSVIENNAGHIIYSQADSQICSAKFLIWDERTMYALISGGSVKLQNLETKSALDWYAIKNAADRGLNYDFEGSMIKRIALAYREFGAKPMPYFRIRKVFCPDIARTEADDAIKNMFTEDNVQGEIK